MNRHCQIVRGRQRAASVRQNGAMADELSHRASVWTRYWSRGAMHSCVGSYDDSYHGPIATFWRAGFDRLATGARVLDIGTGNGPLPKLLLSLESRNDLSCDAIDLAAIAPPWLQQLPAPQRSRIRFHSACAAERMPFADASFDLVVSQWGLEYSELALALPEVLRVLAPGGAVQLLLHHTEALPVTLAAREIDHLVWLLCDDGLLDCAAEMIAPMALAGTSTGRARLAEDPQANEARELFNAQQELLQQRIEHGSGTEVLSEARQAVATLLITAARQGAAPASAALQDVRTGLQDALVRLQELRRHAMDAPAVTVLAQSLARGAPYELDVLRDHESIMGWTLRVTPDRC